MTSDDTRAVVEAALAAAKIRAVRTSLLDLHKALLDAERVRYERTHGRIESPHEALRVVMGDPSFAWLRSISELIITADERLAVDLPVAVDEVRAFGGQVRDLLQGDGGGSDFRDAYQRELQETPDVVVLHGRVLTLLAEK